MVSGGLIGRDRELSVLADLLRASDVRLITVTGPAGVGKTRVASAAADAVQRDGSRRVVRVDLAPLGDPGLVADLVAAAAGADDRSTGRSGLEAAEAALSAAPALLLLDNFEHLGPAAADVAALLDACPDVTALVTSRHVLGITYEHMFPLAPLGLPDADEPDPARALRSAAVALYVARARGRDPTFELTDDVAAAVVETCRRLDGLPLAIELVAAQVAVLPPPALIARWEAAFGLDTRGAHDLPPRQQTLRQAFDWSYHLCDPNEQALLRRLAAFPGGFDISAVEAACRGDGGLLAVLDVEPIPTLARLVDRSLVSRDSGGSASQPRYSQLMTVRGYLRGHLDQNGEAAAADLLMAEACAALAAQAGHFLVVGRPQQELGRLEREITNLYAALEVFIRTEPARAVELVTVLFGLWQARHVREGRAWVNRALSAAGDDLPPGTQARGLWAAANLAHFQGDYDEQRRLAEDSLTAARVAADPLTLARALHAQAMALVGSDDSAAQAGYLESLSLCESVGDEVGIAMACNDLGELARSAGDFAEATAFYERALVGWRALGDTGGIALTAHNLALSVYALGELERAGTLLLESLASAETIGDRHLRAVVLAAIVAVAATQAPTRAVAELYGAVLAELAAAGVALGPPDDGPFREAEQTLRSVLGAERFAAARARGSALSDADQQRLVQHVVEPSPQPDADALTARQMEVMRLMAVGLSNSEIAERLVLSDHTVHRHVSNILGKLGARSRAAAVSIAARRGLL